MAYRFDKTFNKTAYSEWLSIQLEIMAADLDRQIKAQEERTNGADSEFIKDARRRRDNLWLSSDQLKRSFDRGQSEKQRAPASG